jgi:uncharacterized membrane protein YeaQ/YmgE (transglycosylase-associated protein family)
MPVLVTLVVGVVVGWLASILMKTDGQMKILGAVVVGTAGSFIGVAIGEALTVGPSPLGSWVMAVVGAGLLVALLEALGLLDRVVSAR